MYGSCKGTKGSSGRAREWLQVRVARAVARGAAALDVAGRAGRRDAGSAHAAAWRSRRQLLCMLST